MTPDGVAAPGLDLASRALGGSVVLASDETFAAKEHLIASHAARFDPDTFGARGKVYDGWETRRRRDPDRDRTGDWAVVRLGAPGVVTNVVVDTAWFTGNHPPEVSVEATALEDHPSAEEVLAAPWEALVPRSPAAPDTANSYAVDDARRWTHVRLVIHPDGGVARLRVLGAAVPDPRLLTGTVDMAAAGHGGRVLDASDAFYSPPSNLLLPGSPHHMGEGWENRRRRGPGHDWVLVGLAGEGLVRRVEVDTTFFVGNAPGEVRVAGRPRSTGGSGSDGSGSGGDARGSGWVDLVPRRPVRPDTRHLLPVPPSGSPAPEPPVPVEEVRLDVHPDGGLARFRVWGELTAAGLDAVRRRWWEALPEWQRDAVPPHDRPAT